MIDAMQPGVALALYNGGAWSRLLTPGLRQLIGQARPQVLMPHAGIRAMLGRDPDAPDEKDPHALIQELKGLAPGVRVWLGVGVDGWTEALAASPGREDEIRHLLADVCAYALMLGAEAIVWDQEGAGENHPEAGARFARMAIEAGREVGLLQAHTAYDSVLAVKVASHRWWGGHSGYPWKAWLGTDGVDFEMEQIYVADDDGDHNDATLAPHGMLKRRAGWSRQSFHKATMVGRVRPGIPHAPYFQAHGVHYQDTVTEAARHHLAALWAAPTRIDAHGEMAVRALAGLHELGFSGPDAVLKLQRAANLKTDGVFGPRSYQALQTLLADKRARLG